MKASLMRSLRTLVVTTASQTLAVEDSLEIFGALSAALSGRRFLGIKRTEGGWGDRSCVVLHGEKGSFFLIK